MLAKTGPVTYKIQRHARADPEFVNVDNYCHKLLPYQADQADFEEELHSWLQGEESDGRRVAETQTAGNPHLKLQQVLPHPLKVVLLTAVL